MTNAFQIRVTTNTATGEILAVYFRIRKGRAEVTKEHAKGSAFANYDRKGRLLGIELLGPCRLAVLDRIAVEPIAKQFIRRVIPRQLVAA